MLMYANVSVKTRLKFRNFKEEIDFFFNFRDIRSSFVLLLSWFNWIGKMGFWGHQRKNVVKCQTKSQRGCLDPKNRLKDYILFC